MSNPFETNIQEFVYYDKYSRYNHDLGRRETWDETVDRTLDYLRWLSKNTLSDQDYLDIDKHIRNLGVAPSMRLMRTAGAEAKRHGEATFNCAYLPIVSIKAMCEVLWLSMCGVGVGYSVENKYISMLPTIRNQIGDVLCHQVDDSAEGWVIAYEFVLNSLFNGFDVEVDYSLVRPAGAILKTKGGTSSGATVLKDLVEFTRQMIKSKQGKKLSSIDVFDLVTSIGSCAVSGGSRRSAQLTLFDFDDQEMRNAKSGEFWINHPNRSNANISVCVTGRLSRDQVSGLFNKIFANKTGEPGIVSRYAMNRTRPEWRRELVHGGVNACQPEFATVLTPDGIRALGDVGIGDVIWSGYEWTKITRKWHTGKKDVYKYISSYGEFVGTEDHKVFENGNRVEVHRAKKIDARPLFVDESEKRLDIIPEIVMDGLVVGDGSVHKASNNPVYLCVGQDDHDYFESEIGHLLLRERDGVSDYAWEIKTNINHNELPYTYDRFVPERYYKADRQTVVSFLRGLFSANGYCIGNRIGLKQTSLILIKQVQEMLSFVGIASYVTQNKNQKIKWSNGEYESRQSYDINISSDRYKFIETIGFIQSYKNESICGVAKDKHGGTGIVQDKQYLGEYDVYDITVECDDHSYWTGGLLVSNCSEVNLHGATIDGRFGGQTCNLSTVQIYKNDTVDTISEKCRVAAIIGTIQAIASDHFTDGMLRPEWKEICAEERIIGVSLIGVMDNDLARIPELLNIWRDIVTRTNVAYAEKLGINRAAALHVEKPAGSSSVMYGTSRGINARYAEYYIRRVRVNAYTGMYRLLRDYGIKVTPETGQTEPNVSTYVAEFYEKSPGNAILTKQMSAYDQLENWKNFKLNWCTHNPSVTVEYSDDDMSMIPNWFYDNQDIANGISFLPKSDMIYKLAPYEEIDKNTYDKLTKDHPRVDFSILDMYENGDKTKTEVECAAGVCDLF